MTDSELQKTIQTTTPVKEEKTSAPQDPVFDPLNPFLAILNALNRPRQYLAAAPTFVPQTLVDQFQFVDDGVDKWLYVYLNKVWIGIKDGSGGGGSPGGSDGDVQFNDAGVFGGDSQFNFDKTTNTLTLAALILSNALAVAYGGTGATSAAGARANLGAQAQDADLDALAAIASSGLLARTGAGTAAARTITGGSGITVTDGNGVSGNPTISLSGSIAFSNRVSAYLSSNQSTALAAVTVAFDTENFDGLGEYDNTTFQFTAADDGFYLIETKVTVNRGGDSVNDVVTVKKNGSAIMETYLTQRSSTGSYNPFAFESRVFELQAGDVIEVEANIGGSQPILSGDTKTYLTIHRLS
jgi:hypothetical protein